MGGSWFGEQHIPSTQGVEFACVKANFFVQGVKGRGSNGCIVFTA
jgi:hypothetical protein